MNNIIAIGVSTGGPKALQHVIPLLQSDLPSGVLVVQHMPSGFTKSLADRLNEISNVLVKEADDGEKINSGTVYIAPGGYHMKVVPVGEDYFIELSNDMPVNGLKPSFDVLLSSLARTHAKLIVAVMTGMGNDGTNGIKKLDKKNTYIIAQNEETSTIFGMPSSAIKTGLIDIVLPVDEIANEIDRIARRI
jgi:two-component system chemotaxis response regulator CheB